MTLQQAKSVARHLRFTLRQLRSGKYRVNYREGEESTACYTDKLEEAVNVAIEMARKRPMLHSQPTCLPQLAIEARREVRRHHIPAPSRHFNIIGRKTS